MTDDLADAIDAALRRVGPYGEVTLVLDNMGRVHFIEERVSHRFVSERQMELVLGGER